MSEIYDDDDRPDGEWWADDCPTEISNDLYTMAVRWYEHGLPELIVEEAGISYGNNSELEINFPDPSDDYNNSCGPYDPDLDIILAVHPDKDCIQEFPGGEYNYLRYADRHSQKITRIVLADFLMCHLIYIGIPVTQRRTIGEAELDEIGRQDELYEEKVEQYYSKQGDTQDDDGDVEIDWEVSDEDLVTDEVLHEFFFSQGPGGEREG
jgi:hypothetical protein